MPRTIPASVSQVAQTALAFAITCAWSAAIQAQDARALARKIFPSVLTLEVYDRSGNMISGGSAFFISPDVIATCFHVIKAGHSAYAHTSDKSLNYCVLGIVAEDQSSDVVLLKLKGANGTPLKLAADDQPEAGEPIFVFGSPQGLEGSVATGVVASSTMREVEGAKFIQLSAPISPGNSGGPVVNIHGEAIGLVTRSALGAQNLNFAASVTIIKQLVKKSRFDKLNNFTIRAINGPPSIVLPFPF